MTDQRYRVCGMSKGIKSVLEDDQSREDALARVEILNEEQTRLVAYFLREEDLNTGGQERSAEEYWCEAEAQDKKDREQHYFIEAVTGMEVRAAAKRN